MAPNQSRVAGKGLSLGLLTAGAACGSQLFVAPFAGQRAPATAAGSSSRAQGRAQGIADGQASGPSLASLAIVGAGLAAARAAKTSVAASATEAPAPPPPFNPAEQIGTGAPLGFFDPLGFTAVGDERGFNKLRASEIKHGRVAMMASIGLVGQHFIKFPFFENAPAGFKLMGTGEGVLGFVVILMLSGILELAWRDRDGFEPGNFGDPFGVNMYNEEMRSKELNNGRMAMISVLGIFAAEMATGKDAIQQFGI